MFVTACQEAAKFTRPVVISARRLDGSVATSIGSCVVLNQDGWVATAGHMIGPMRKAQDDEPLVKQYDAEVARINSETPNNDNLRRNRLKKVGKDDGWIRNLSYWWGQDGVTVAELAAYPMSDIAILRLENLSTVQEFPTFKEPSGIQAGTSLVKVGFPFHEIQSAFDESAQGFKFDASGLTLFPIEGMLSRIIDNGTSPEGVPIKFVATSSPGLMGQSGGPTLDKNGVVYAIQSMTQHYDLGFSPEIKKGRDKVKEHQFLNVGLGVHTDTLANVFARHQVTVAWTP